MRYPDTFVRYKISLLLSRSRSSALQHITTHILTPFLTTKRAPRIASLERRRE